MVNRCTAWKSMATPSTASPSPRTATWPLQPATTGPSASGTSSPVRSWNAFVPENVNAGYSVAFSPDGRLLLVGHQTDAILVIWDREAKKEVRRFSFANSRDIVSVQFSPDGHYALSGASDGAVRRVAVDKNQDGAAAGRLRRADRGRDFRRVLRRRSNGRGGGRGRQGNGLGRRHGASRPTSGSCRARRTASPSTRRAATSPSPPPTARC